MSETPGPIRSLIRRVIDGPAPPALPAADDASAAPRNDGLANALSGLGVAGVDKSLSSRATRHTPLDQQSLEWLYDGDDIVGRMVNAVPEDCTRRGWEVQASAGDDVSDPFTDILERIGMRSAMREAHTWARLHGGGAVILGVDDGQDPEAPVIPEQVKGIQYVMAVDRHELTPHEWESDAREPWYGQPRTYHLTPQDGVQRGGQPVQVVHADRVLRFEGGLVTRRRRVANNWWGGSVVDAAFPPLRAYNSALQGMAHIVHEYEIQTLGIKGLRAMMQTADHREKLLERVMLFRQGKGIAKLGVIDADGESLSRQTASVSGLADLYDRFQQAVAGAAEMPLSRLFGQGPSGFSADDQAGARWYYDRVAYAQSQHYEPHLLRVASWLVAGGVVDVPDEASISVSFRSLHEPTDKERAEVRLIDAQADEIHWRIGAIDEVEVRTGYIGAGYSSDRRALTAQERANLAVDAPDNGEAGGAPGGDA